MATAPSTPHFPNPKSAVPTTHTRVTPRSAGFLEALRSAHLPRNGPAIIAPTADIERASPQTNSAHEAPPQIVRVKKTPPTTVITTVTNALFAKSYQHHAKISPLPAGPIRSEDLMKEWNKSFLNTPTNKYPSHAHPPTLVESHNLPPVASPSAENFRPSTFDQTQELISLNPVRPHMPHKDTFYASPPTPHNSPDHPAIESLTLSR